MQRQNLIALLLAVIAAVLAYYVLTDREAAMKADVTPVKVLVAKSHIARGSALTAEKVQISEIPGAYVMPGAMASAGRAGVVKQWETFQGQFAVVPIAKGEQILPNKLSQIMPGFAGVVPEGKRIIALAFDPAAALGGHLKPGNQVDVLGVFEHQFQGGKRTTSVILAQDIMVTAVGGETALEKSRKPAGESGGVLTVCLAVSPEDTVRLALAEREGALKLALRSVGDHGLNDLPDQNLGSVLGPLMKVQREEIKPAPRRIEIIRGTDMGR